MHLGVHGACSPETMYRTHSTCAGCFTCHAHARTHARVAKNVPTWSTLAAYTQLRHIVAHALGSTRTNGHILL